MHPNQGTSVRAGLELIASAFLRSRSTPGSRSPARFGSQRFGAMRETQAPNPNTMIGGPLYIMCAAKWYWMALVFSTPIIAACSDASVFAGGFQSSPATAGDGRALMPILSVQQHEAPARSTYRATEPLLYVVDVGPSPNDVKVYRARAEDPGPMADITTGIYFPTGDCLDGSGTLYVANEPASGPGWVSVYRKGEVSPSRMITEGIDSPAFCAVDALGDLWVTNISGRNVTEYKKGSSTPQRVITKGLDFPVGVAIDHTGNLYVANGVLGSSQNVQVYAPGTESPSRTITDGVTSPVGIAADAQGTLYVSNISQNNVEEYRAGKSHPYRAITLSMDEPTAVTIDKAGRVYVTNFANNVVVEFPPHSLKPSVRRISKGLYTPEGSAYFPPLLP
jgi:hypothetical protein